jgi:hypothetical protein
MDPLSITASVIAVATFAAQICSAFQDLRNLCKSLPGRLHALNNEVADLELVLFQIASLAEQRACLPNNIEFAIPHQLKQAKARLTELENLLRTFSKAYQDTKNPLVGARLWRKESEKIKSLQESIQSVKGNLIIMLGAANS